MALAKMQWLRLYADLLEDRKAQSLPAPAFKIWINALCLACRHQGFLPGLDDCAFAFRMQPEDVKVLLTNLQAAGLIDRTEDGRLMLHNWRSRQYVSDSSSERTGRYRKRKRETSMTVPATVGDGRLTGSGESGDGDGDCGVTADVTACGNGGCDGKNGRGDGRDVSGDGGCDGDVTAQIQIQRRADKSRGRPPYPPSTSEMAVTAAANEPSPTVTPHDSQNALSVVDFFEERYGRHPKKRDRALAERALAGIDGIEAAAVQEKFRAGHEAWMDCEDWLWKNGVKAPTFAEFISDKTWTYRPQAESESVFAQAAACIEDEGAV